MNEFMIRPATPEDAPAMERLMLHCFPHLFARSMGDRPDSVKVEVLTRLRLARRDPAAGHHLAVTLSGEVVGMMAYETSEMTEGFSPRRLTALRPLGPAGVARFLLVARLSFIAYRPAPGEIYIRNGAVAAGYRRMGLAAAMLQSIEAQTRALGAERYTGLVASGNRASQKLLLAAGYTPIGEVRHPLRGRLLGEPALIRYEKAARVRSRVPPVGFGLLPGAPRQAERPEENGWVTLTTLPVEQEQPA